jgi:hypothetical protein
MDHFGRKKKVGRINNSVGIYKSLEESKVDVVENMTATNSF